MLVGLVWAIALYFAACMLTGAITGGIAGSRDPEHASIVGREAGIQVVTKLRLYFLVGAALIAAVGSYLGFLPGTGKEENVTD
jgi:hypothetical protein